MVDIAKWINKNYQYLFKRAPVVESPLQKTILPPAPVNPPTKRMMLNSIKKQMEESAS